MGWFLRLAMTEDDRISRNIERLEALRSKLHDLAYFAVASNSGGFQVLKGLLDDRLILGRPNLHAKLNSALIGENNQKIALDSPHRFQSLMFESEEIVKQEINKEKKALRVIQRGRSDQKGSAKTD